jgi:2'-5' RNA ligase
VRLFIAIALPPTLGAEAAAILPPALPGLRRVKAENLHVTLAFLGWTPDEQLDQVTSAALEAAASVAPFDVEFRGAGRFPERGRPRVVWLGIAGGAENVRSLGAAVAQALRSRRLKFDDRPLSPHLTLARVADDASAAETRTVAAAVSTLAPPALRFRVGEVAVFQSVLSPKGPRYTALATAPLGRA